MQTRITVNGVEYRSVEEMPPDVRRQYEKTMQVLGDGDGVPDVLQGKGAIESIRSTRGATSIQHEATVEHIQIDGKTYDRLEDVPPELREMIERARSSGQPQTIVETHTCTPLLFRSTESSGLIGR